MRQIVLDTETTGFEPNEGDRIVEIGAVELIGGRQPDFGLGAAAIKTANTADAQDWRPTARPNALPPRITNEEAAAHTAFIESLGDGVLWNRD